jgi:site-specific DNA-methyltransferase (adenine-specific)
MLPEELFQNPDTKFLDPACKTGVFLREIAKRLIKGLEPQIPDLQERIDHIFHNQLYGIAITELTSLLSRRGVYCSKYPNSEFSVTQFDTAEGNIRYKRINHTWQDGRCVFCGASQKTELGDSGRGETLEAYAYEFIHVNTKEIYNMKFDVIIGNPPYQLKVNETGKGLGAIPIYHRFIEQAQKLKPRYISMIIPARWFAGGVGLDGFRNDMLRNKHIKRIVDYIDSKDCFPGVDVNGGICYFLIDSQYNGDCEYTNISNGERSTAIRKLNEYDIFVRRNEAVSIIKKTQKLGEKTLDENGGCSPQTPYGFLSTYIGRASREYPDDCELLSSKGWTYVRSSEIMKSRNTVNLYKPMISKLSCEHAGNPDKNGMYRVLSRMELLKPNQICSQSYLTVCMQQTEEEAKNVYDYLRTKFVRFLILQTLVGMNLSINNFRFVPWQDFTKSWTDEELYEKYNLTQEEIEFIESMIKPME